MTTLASSIKEAYLARQPIDAARLIETLKHRDLPGLFEGVQPSTLATCLDYLTAGHAAAVFQSLGPEQQRGVLREAPPRLALALLDSMSDEGSEALLESLPRAVRSDLERLQQFDADSAGRLLDRPYDTIRTDMTVAEALETLRRSGARRTRSVYIADRQNRLAGKVDMQSMAMADGDTQLGDLLEPLEGKVTVTSPRKEVVEQLERYRVDSLPVTDVEGHLLGIVRYQRLFEVIESVATADMQKMVGASEDERALSAAMFSVKKRLPWLHINLLTAFLAAAAGRRRPVG